LGKKKNAVINADKMHATKKPLNQPDFENPKSKAIINKKTPVSINAAKIRERLRNLTAIG
jgi:hypothetical protein